MVDNRESEKSIDFDRAFFYPFEDSGAPGKLLLWGILMCFPVLQFFSLGFFQKGIEQTARGEDTSLPDWSQWGNLFWRGLCTSVILMVYFIPFLLLVLPIPGLLRDFFLQEKIVNFFPIMLLLCLLLVYVFFVKFFIPLALLEYSLSGRLRDSFAIMGFWQKIGSSRRLYLRSFMYILLMLIVMQLGFLIVVGLLVTVPYGFMVIAHLIGQLGMRHKA